MVETTEVPPGSSGASAGMLNRSAEKSPSEPPASMSSQQNPPAIVEPYLATLPSDSDSSDERSVASSTDDSHDFRPSHHLLGPPELKRTGSVSSISSYGTDSPTNGSGRDSDDEPIAPRLGSSGSTAQNWMTCGPFTAYGRWFRDQEGRTCLLRGVNLCGNSKLPTKPSGSTHLNEGFFEHRDVSFVGRPFPLEEVDEHLGRLKAWGLTFVRLLVPWEALEHSGPGIYDDEYIDYLIKIIEKMPEYGIKCFIDPHQDTWSRFSGGSGAPGWTFEVAGLDITKFMATGAAYVHNTISKTGDLLPMVWPTNYTKLASATMFTLFWAGNVFAPNAKYEGISVQDFLQERYLACYQHLARKIQHLEAAIGFELMNEPHEGYIGLKDLNRFDANHTLVYGDAPSALQSFALGAGLSQEIEVWGRSWPFPTRKHKTRMMNEEHESAWLDGRDCIWRQHGVWDADPITGKPKLLRPDYFQRHPETGEKLEFYKDFYLEFINNYSRAIQSIKNEYFIFVEPLPNEPPPVWTANDHHEGIVYAPHWYDLKSLFTKTFDGYITHDVQGLSRGKNVISATYFGLGGAKKNYTGQVRNIVKGGLLNVGAKPCIIGECGIPMDLNDKRAFETNDYTHQSNFLDAVLCAMERNLVYFTLWNYNPSNDNTHGDHWNGEDFSIYSPIPKSRKLTETKSTAIKKPDKKQRAVRRQSLRIQTTFERKETSGVSSGSSDSDSDPGAVSPTSPFELVDAHFRDERIPDEAHHHHIGGRALDAVLRPYAAKVPGEPESMVFNLKTLAFTFKFTNYPAERSPFVASMLPPEVEIFVPSYHYRHLDLEIRVSEGDWRYVKNRQTLYWRVKDCTTEGITHTLRIRVADPGRVSNGHSRVNGHAYSEEAEGSYNQEEEDARTIAQLQVHFSIAVAFGAILVAMYWQVYGGDWGSMLRL